MSQDTLPNPDVRRSELVSRLATLATQHVSHAQQLEDVRFMLEQKMLGNNQVYLLRIGDARLAIPRNEPEAGVLDKVEQFVLALEATTVASPVGPPATHPVRVSVKATIEPLVEGKDKVYWRDVAVGIVGIKHAFLDTPLANSMTTLRGMINTKSVGVTPFSVEFEGIQLAIGVGETEDAMLLKLAQFIRRMKDAYPERFAPTPPREDVEETQDRKKIWATILSGLVSIKKAYRGSAFGEQVAELKDLIDDYKLGYVTPFHVEAPSGAVLNIQVGEELNTRVEKLARFIEAVQTGDPEKFPENKVSATKAVKEKQAEKIYWTDVIAGLDTLQGAYPAEQYPAIQTLKEMIERNELGSGARLMLSVGPVVLSVLPADSDKAIKNKVTVFIGALKQIAPQSEEPLDKIYWRDILASLKGLEDAYGDNADFQMLVMMIDMGTLATVKDFKIIIDGVELKVVPRDTDQQLKEKLDTFIKELKAARRVTVDQKAFEKSKRRIEELEAAQARIEAQYRRQLDDERSVSARLEEKSRKQAEQIRDLRDELRDAKSRVTYTPVRSYSG